MRNRVCADLDKGIAAEGLEHFPGQGLFFTQLDSVGAIGLADRRELATEVTGIPIRADLCKPMPLKSRRRNVDRLAVENHAIPPPENRLQACPTERKRPVGDAA